MFQEKAASRGTSCGSAGNSGVSQHCAHTERPSLSTAMTFPKSTLSLGLPSEGSITWIPTQDSQYDYYLYYSYFSTALKFSKSAP